MKCLRAATKTLLKQMETLQAFFLFYSPNVLVLNEYFSALEDGGEYFGT